MRNPAEKKPPVKKTKKPLFPLTRKNGEPVTWSSILSNRRILQILSVAAAVFVWAMVSTGAAVQETKTIKNVPIEFDASGSLYQTFGLKLVYSDVDAVDVTVTGPRYVVSSLSASDIKVTAVTANVTTAGEHTVDLRVGFQESGIDAEVLLKSNEPVNASFDTFTSLTFTLEAEKEGDISVATGYVLGSVTVSPATVTVEAPNAIAARISKAVVTYNNKKSKLTAGFIGESEITLFDAEGGEIPAASVKLSENTAEVSVPVLKRKKLNVAVTLQNAPEGWSKYLKITPSTIDIAGPADVIDLMTELVVGSIDTSSVTGSGRTTFTLSLGQNMLDVNQVGYVAVDIDYSKVKSKNVTINHIDPGIGNIDLSGYSVTVVTTILENVTVYAPSGDIGAISTDHLKAVATLTPDKLTAGQISLPVKIVSTNGKMVWTVGTYNIVVNITPKS